MAHIALDDLVTNIGLALDNEFPDEQFLEIELYAVIQGLFTSLHWAALRKAKETQGFLDSVEGITDLETVDHFASPWLSKREIVDRVMHTSGLSASASLRALVTVEALIDKRLSEGESYVAIDEIGLIEAPALPRYSISLAASLRVKPSHLAVRIGSAE